MRTSLTSGLALLLLAVPGAGPGSADPAKDEIVCQNLQTPVEVARNVFVIETETRCFHPGHAEQSALERVKIACDVLIAAYGREDGGLRCREIVERTELEIRP